MRVHTPTIVIAAVFGGAALLAAFVVSLVVNARRDLPPGAELPRKGVALLAPDTAPEGGGWLTGQVTAARGALPAGATVYAQRPGGAKEPPARAEVNPGGHYRLALP